MYEIIQVLRQRWLGGVGQLFYEHFFPNLALERKKYIFVGGWVWGNADIMFNVCIRNAYVGGWVKKRSKHADVILDWSLCTYKQTKDFYQVYQVHIRNIEKALRFANVKIGSKQLLNAPLLVREIINMILCLSKGQLISKGLFWFFQFSQKN